MKSVSMNLKIVTLLFLLLNFAKIETVKNEKKATSGFFFSMPRTLLAGKNETVCLSTHYLLLPVKVTVDLKIKEDHFSTSRIIDSENSCFELHVPCNNKKEPHFAGIRVQIQANNTIYSAHNYDPIMIYPNKKFTFIETDRMTYKSEDTVKIRILILEENLLPAQNYKLSYVRIRNPVGVGVMIWENVTTEFGLAHFEHQLTPESLVGKWKIEANGEVKIFEVSKYLLPRFKVFIVHPKIIYVESSSVTMKVCAKYSYSGIVKGIGFIRLSDSYHYTNTEVLKEMTDGCATFHFSASQLSFKAIREKFSQTSTKMSILITATVTEHGTDKIELTTAKSYIVFKAYEMKFLENNIFLPGLPYHGTVHFNNVNIDLRGEVIEICYNIAVKKSWNYLNNEQCSNFTVMDNKIIQFHILPLKSNVIHVQLSARSLNHSNIDDSLLVVRVYSPSSAYLMLNQMDAGDMSKCGSMQQFSVEYSVENLGEHENITFYYMVKSRNQIYKMRKVVHGVRKYHLNYTNEYKHIIGSNHRHTKFGSPIGKFTLKFKLDKKILSKYQLLVYYVSTEGELISASKDFEIDLCLNNEVNINWSHKQIVPAGTASLLLETKSDSLCSVAAIDKATQFMDGINLLNVKTLLKPFLQERENAESGRKSCVPPTKRSRRVSSLIENDPIIQDDLQRMKRFVYSFSEDYDAYDIFNKFGVTTISNYKVVTKPCYTGPLPPPTNNPVQYLTDQYDTQNDERVMAVRSFFPETWLWELIPVRNVAVIHRSLPHSITTWVTNAMCISLTDGVGFGKTTEISAFQPFFIDLLIPHSIKKGETLYVHAIVFNYLTYNIPIRISLQASDGLTPVHTSNRNSYSYCISSNNSFTHVFDMKATKIKKVNITVSAELDPAYPGQCGPDILINKRDAVSKEILIESDGYPVQITKSALLCGSDQRALKNVTWSMKASSDAVPETPRTKIVLNGNILGQALENFDNLIVLPRGCGEQIMANLAPNLYIFKYLNATNTLTASTRHKILRNLKIGYQRILNYVHKDGSFSAFGYHDPAGSMFLTAFVVRTLRDMKRYIYVDQKIVDRAVAWILNHQLENGCFSTMLHVFQDMGGTTVENSTAGLTSYVIISLVDAGIEIPEPVKTNAKYCIRGHYNLDKYTLAISSYALLKVNWYSEANRMLKKLFQISTQKDNMMWWTNKGTVQFQKTRIERLLSENSGSLASDTEITSYVLLSLLNQKTEENLAKAYSIAQWLSAQQGPHGGFRSTQDTVVGLDALTKYAHLMNRKLTNLTIIVETNEEINKFTTNNEDRLKSKTIDLKKADNDIKIHIQGEGCVLAQATLSYFIKHIPGSKAFKLDMEIVPASNVDKCSIATLSSCFTYNGPDAHSNMAILEVGLPSGYEADRSSLYKLIDEDKTTKVKMFEELRQKIILYMTKLNSDPVCINFDINENAIVQTRSNSTVKLYDYYKPEYYVVKFYKINDKCNVRNLAMPNISKEVTTENGEMNSLH